MAFRSISPVERSFIAEGIELNLRADGRERIDHRRILIETGIISQSSGSARCVSDGGTVVLVGVKVEVGSIDAAVVDEGGEIEEGEEGSVERDRNIGRIVCNVECSPSAHRAFDSRQLSELSNSYSQFLTRLLNGPQGGIDLKSLCIIPGSTCWVVYIDVLVLDFGGNLMDAISMAVCGALRNTRMPKATVEELDGQMEFDISDEETEYIKGADQVPFCLTLNKIGDRFIVDATPLEELCTDAKLLLGVNKKGQICSMQKSGEGSIDPSLLTEMIQTGRQVGMNILSEIDSALKSEGRRIANKKEALGFLF